jgi:hypothetical protein
MASPAHSVAEALRQHGAAYLAEHRLSTPQAKAWRGIVACRTAALGGQHLACDACGHSHWQYHSCLMGSLKLRGVGMNTATLHWDVRSSFACGNSPLREVHGYRVWAIHGPTHQETSMLENYFCASKTLRRLRVGLSGPYIDGFADALELNGYSSQSAVRYLRAAAHFGCFVHRKGGVLADVDACMLEAFGRHFRRCRCPESNGGTTGYHARFGVKLFHRYLVRLGICRIHAVADGGCVDPGL